MSNVKIPIHYRNIQKRLETLDSWKICDQDKKDLRKFIEELGMGKVNKGKRVGESRQLRYLDLLKTPFEFLNKPISSLTIKDIESFEKAMNSDKIKSKLKKKPFSAETKSTLKKAFKIYLNGN